MSDLVLGIRLTADGKDLVGAVRVSGAEIDKMGEATKRAASEARRLNEAQKGLAGTSAALSNALRTVVGAYGLAQLISLTDQYTKFNAQLKLVSASHNEYAQSLSEVRRIATLAQSSLGETAVLYARITNAVRELGITQRGVSDITETISLALKASGATATESASAMLQLSQAFGSGVLRGEEFNAVNEAAPRLMRALAEGIGAPVGRLRQMAEAGKLTAEVMANALPRALADLRKEAASVQTIAGAFQVFKNNVMEFVGEGAQANGAARVLAGSIGLLAENLALLAGVALTVMASKLAQWATTAAAAMYGHVAASRAAALATLENARAGVVATGSAAALTAARLAELRAVVIAAEGNVALAITTNGLVPAQAAATAASAAHTAALSALTVAQRGASVAATAGSAALAFLGGPIGAITVALGLAATAWAVWGRSAKDANAQAQDSTVSTSAEILAALARQNDKLRERIALSKAGNADAAKEGGPAAEKLASTLNEINALKAKGSALTNVDRIALIELQGRYDDISAALKENKTLTGEIGAIGQRSKAAEWAEEYATKAEKLASTLAKARAELGAAFSPELEKKIREKFTEKSSTGGDPYPALLKNLKEKLLLDREATEVAKLQLDLEALSASQRAKVTPAKQAQLERTAAQVDAQKLNNAAIENTAKNEEALAKARTEAATAQAAFDKQRDDAIIAAYKNLDQMEFEVTLIGMTNAARERAIALRALETSNIDKQSFAYKDLQQRIEAALGSKAAADKQKQFAEDMQRAHVVAWQSIERTAHDTFISIWDSGKSTLDRLYDTLKNGLYELLYQMTLKKWIFNISGSVSGAGVAQSAFGASGGALDLFSTGASLYNKAAGWFTGPSAAAGAMGAGALGSGLLVSSGSAAAMGGGFAAGLGTGVAGMGGAAGTGLSLGAAGATGLSASAASAGMAAGATSTGFTAAMAAIPGWGWAALAAAAVGAYLLSDEGDAQRTGNWSAGLGEVGRSTKNKWFDASTGAGPFAAELAAQEQQMVKLLKLSADQTATINTALDALSGNVYGFGMERTDWTQSGAAQAIAADRLRAIADSLGLSVESLAAKMADAQKQIDIAPAKLQLEIDLMKLQGKGVEALAAERKRELAALDPLLRGLQEQIYAEQDLAAAANDAGNAVSALAEVLKETQSAVDTQIGASRSAGQAARATADSYRGLTATLADTVRTLRGGDLSPLLPRQKLDEARANVEATYAKAMTQDAAAIAALPQLVTDFVTASRAYNASSDAFTADFNRGVEILAKAGSASDAAAAQQDHMATLYQSQTNILESIRDLLASPSVDSAALGQQIELLGQINRALTDPGYQIPQSLQEQINATDAGSAQQADGLNKTVALLQQLLYLNVVAEKAAAEQSVFAAADAFVRGAKDYAVQNASSYFAVESTLYQGLTPTGSGGSSVKALYDAYNSSVALMLNVQQQLAALERIGASTAFYDLPGHAAGGVASGWSMVGELGPELVNFSAPGRVYTAEQTSAALGAGVGKEDVARLEKLMEETNAILARLVAAQSSGTATIATAVEDSAQTIGRTVARAAEAGARA